MRRSFFILLIFIIALFVLIENAFAQWVAPTVPPPGGLTPPPLNTGTVNQTKNSDLTTNNLQVNSGSVRFGVGGGQSLLGSGGTSINHFSNTNSESFFSIRKYLGDSYGQLYGTTIGTTGYFGLQASSTPGPFFILEHVTNFAGVPQYTALRVANFLVMTLLSNGNVGIGTGAPENKLHLFNTGVPDNTQTNPLKLEGRFQTGVGAPITRQDVLGIAFKFRNQNDTVTQEHTPIRFSISTAAPITQTLALMMSGGNVGIGTVSPGGKLDVTGGYLTAGLTPPAGLAISAGGASPNRAQVVWGDNTGWKLNFGTRDAAGLFQSRVTFLDTGNVGIGIENPGVKLEVAGTIEAAGLTTKGAPIQLRNSGVGAREIQFYRLSGVAGQTIWYTEPGNKLTIGPQDAAKSITVQDDGNVGIGTQNPSARLEVAGQIKITGGGPLGAGKVLTSDATGLASWGNITGLPTCLNKEYIRYNGVSLAWECTKDPPSGDHYFLLSQGSFNGNLLGYAQTNLGFTGTDGLQAANAICLNEVNTLFWKNKPVGKSYNSSQVHAFLCGTSGCYNLAGGETYTMATLGDIAKGGWTFTTDASGKGPQDTKVWSDPDAFGVNAETWSGREWTISASFWELDPQNVYDHCQNWTVSAGAQASRGGTSSGGGARWAGSFGLICAAPSKLICAVDGAGGTAPPPSPETDTLQSVTDRDNNTTTWITASDVQSSVAGKWLSQAVTLAAPCADQQYLRYNAGLVSWECTGGDLQTVTDNGNSTTRSIFSPKFIKKGSHIKCTGSGGDVGFCITAANNTIYIATILGGTSSFAAPGVTPESTVECAVTVGANAGFCNVVGNGNIYIIHTFYGNSSLASPGVTAYSSIGCSGNISASGVCAIAGNGTIYTTYAIDVSTASMAAPGVTPNSNIECSKIAGDGAGFQDKGVCVTSGNGAIYMNYVNKTNASMPAPGVTAE